MAMANDGEWRPAFGFLARRSPGIREIRRLHRRGEVVQGFLAAYLSVTDYYVFRSEAELGKGHADISLEPLLARYPHLRVGYLIELKYLKRTERSPRSEPADETGVAGGSRMRRRSCNATWRTSGCLRQFPGVRFVGLAVVFHGWELTFCDAVA